MRERQVPERFRSARPRPAQPPPLANTPGPALGTERPGPHLPRAPPITLAAATARAVRDHGERAAVGAVVGARGGVIQGQNGGFAYSYDPIVDTDRNLHGDLVQPDPLVKPAYEPLRSATFCYSLPQQNFNGCTLGYWKQSQHFDSWPADIAPSHSLRNHFGPNAYADTLLNARLETAPFDI